VSIFIDGTAINESTTTFAHYNATLGGGLYNVTAVNIGNENYTSNYTTWWFNISQAASEVNLTINQTDANYTLNVSDYANHTGLVITGEGNLTLYENGTQIGQGGLTLETIKQYTTMGMYNITLKLNATQNYTSNTETHWLNFR